MKRTWKLAIGTLATCLLAAVAAAAGAEVVDLYTPSLLSSSASSALVESPTGDALNPAAAGAEQRVKLELGYIGIGGFGAEPGWGNEVNFGFAIPSPVGVFSGSARFMNSSFSPFNVGAFGGFNLSFAKDVYPDLLLGAGIGFQIGTDWGLGLDLGFVHRVGDLGFLKDFLWGFSMRNMGKGYALASTPIGIRTAPPVFTPDFGVRFSLFKTDAATLSISSDLAFPSFQDVRFGIGLEFSSSDTIFVTIAYGFDLAETLANVARTVPLSFGAAVKLHTDGKGDVKFLDFTKRGWNKSDVTIVAGAAPYRNGIWGMGLGARMAMGQIDKNPPVITLASTEVSYISPETASSQGILTVPFTITDERYIKGYRLSISDGTGKVVRTIQESDEGPTSAGFQNFVDRLAVVKKDIAVPPSLSWDGKDDAGAKVPDGAYSYKLESWDDNHNEGRTDPVSVVVDTVPPSASVSTLYLEFSPSGEGTKGSLTIQQTGSSEDLWVGTILDEGGNEVRQFRWTAESPKPFEWQGKDSNGRLAPDGVYSYRIASMDRAGNATTVTLPGIVINTKATPISLSTDLPAFSPNGDGVQDSLRFLPDIAVTDGIENWKLTIKDRAGSVRRVYTGETQAPSPVEFDGKDGEGKSLPEGSYTGSLNVVYRNGHTPTADSLPVLLRVTPPSVTVSASNLEFSPDGVGTRTTLAIRQTGSLEILWEGTVRDASGQRVRGYAWHESVPKDLAWDGRDDGGRLAPDGQYTYRIVSTDPAGNTGSAELTGILINTAATPVTLSVAYAAFSPNGDGSIDTLRLGINAQVTRGVEKWGLVVADQAGTSRRSYSGASDLPAWIDFDGKDDRGAVLAEGTYTGSISILYTNGHDPKAKSPAFSVDLTPPTARTSSDYTVFSPIGEGTRSTLTFTQTGSTEESWSGIVKNSAGQAVRTATWKGSPEAQFVFNGLSDAGSLLSDGKYTYTLAGRDRAGNVGSSAPLAFEIDTTATPVILSADLAQFSPNGDGVKDTIRIVPSLKVSTGVESFELRIKNDKGVVVRRSTGSNAAPGEFVWNGLDDARQRVSDGQYTAELDVLYRNGNHPIVRTSPFAIETVYPAITLSSDVLLFSPTEDSMIREITIRQSSSEEDLWEGRIEDAQGREARNYSWKGKATDFSWDGKDDRGNVASDGQYTYVVSATDRAGNTAGSRLEGITVDSRPTPVSVSTSSDGLSPNADGFRDAIALNLSAGLNQGIKEWKLSVVHAERGVLRTFRGAASLPQSAFWDGKTDAGTIVEGSYVAEMEVLYVKGNRSNARSAPFILSVSPPRIDIRIGPLPFSPDGDGTNDMVSIDLTAAGASPVESWKLTMLDPAEHFFTEFSGKGAPGGSILWDGLSANGELVQSAEDYSLTATVRDELGNVATLRKLLPIDILVIREGDKLKVRVTSITFQANTADYQNVEADRAEKNMQTLQRLAQIFTKFAQYKIRIEGHAVMVYWDKPEEGKKEQETVLIPLSKARAEAIKAALVKLGIDANRISTEGLGGAVPIVPFSDTENRWKDRRVEFILVR